MRRIAFYAPVKPPDHPIPSGDREISRLLIKAMKHAGHQVDVASRYIAYQKRPGEELFQTRKAGGEAEQKRLLDHYRSLPADERPDLWFTYHTYCKAPDYLGPGISEALGIPYVTAEACRTRQNTDKDWQNGRDIVQASIRMAKINFCLKPSDADYLLEVLGNRDKVVDLPPFIDAQNVRQNGGTNPPAPFDNDYPTVLAAGMMRPGKKAECYGMLAEALKTLTHDDWNLIVVGDGPERESIEAQLDFITGDRKLFTGVVTPEEVHGYMAVSDIFAWPGYKEPIGMVYLEAQALGLPVAAMASLGVPTVVGHEESGLLSKEADTKAYGVILQRLIDDGALRRRLGEGGRRRIAEHHGIEAAADLISRHVDGL